MSVRIHEIGAYVVATVYLSDGRCFRACGIPRTDVLDAAIKMLQWCGEPVCETLSTAFQEAPTLSGKRRS